jgi:hypothetical protein
VGLMTRLAIPVLQLPVQGKTCAEVRNKLVKDKADEKALKAHLKKTLEDSLKGVTEPIVSNSNPTV